MEANSFSSSSTCTIANVNQSLFPTKLPFGRKRVVAVREANNRDFEGKLVDENMIILRMRIKDMKIMEENNSHGPAAAEDWMEWEKQYYCKHYHEDVCAAIGWLQLCLMNTRPSLALGMVALIALSLPISASVVIFNVFQMVHI